MIEIDTVHDFFELLRPLLQEGPVKIIVGSKMIILGPKTDPATLQEPALALVADTVQKGGQLRVFTDFLPPIAVAGRTTRIS